MLPSRQLAWPAYLVAIALMAIPLVDAWTTLYPWSPGDARWRFGAVGLVSNALLIPMAGLLVAMLIAWFLEQRVMLRTIGVFGFFASAVCLVALAFFGLDAVQTRASVRLEMQTSFHVASITAAVKMALAGATFFACGLSAWRGSRGLVTRKSSGAAGGLFTLPTAPSTMKPGEPR